MDITKKKSIIEILKAALQRETEAFNFYYKASQKASYPETEALFIQLAEEERRHRSFILDEINRLEKYISQKQKDNFDEHREISFQLPAEITLKRLQTTPNVDLAAISLPVEFFGGDYIDTIALHQQTGSPLLGVFLFDVMGHSMEATKLKALAKKAFGMLREDWIQGKNQIDFSHPSKVISKLNLDLINECQAYQRFVTAFYSVIDTENKKFIYSSAGHEPPILIKASGDYIPLTESDLILCINPEVTYSATTVPIDVGDVIVVFSDGITEACNDKEEPFERERLCSAVHRSRSGNASEIVTHINEALRIFLGNQPMADEFTLVVMKIKA